MAEEKQLPSSVLKSIAETFRQLQTSLEPVRDRALDEKAKAGGFSESAQYFLNAGIKGLLESVEKRARMEGYAQCAEQFLAVIVTKMNDLSKQAEEATKRETEERINSIKDQFSATVNNGADRAGEEIEVSSPA